MNTTATTTATDQSSNTITIFYKFRSSPNYETLTVRANTTAAAAAAGGNNSNGNAMTTSNNAKLLFEIKRSIVKAKNLDKSTGLDFDLVLRNANTNAVLEDSMTSSSSLLELRGVRLIVQRMPAQRGCGLLAQMARLEKGLEDTATTNTNNKSVVYPGSHPNHVHAIGNFYTLQNDAEEEFVDNHEENNDNRNRNPNPDSIIGGNDKEVGFVKQEDDEELAAVQAVTESANWLRPNGQHKTWSAGMTTTMSAQANTSTTGTSAVAGMQQSHLQQQQRIHLHARPTRTADPELREREQQLLQQQQQATTKKRSTGIPRTFIAAMGGTEDETAAANSKHAFQSLIAAKGGGPTSAQLLPIALTLTNKTIPPHLTCSVCQKLAHTAMFLPWDPEGRTACEECIRPKLLQSGYTCPVSGVEGVNPEDLRANVGLRKAVEGFVQEVLTLYEQIVRENDDTNGTGDEQNEKEEKADKTDILDETLGIQQNHRIESSHSQRQNQSLDPFDSFGGDVFEVAIKESSADKEESEEKQEESDRIEPEEIIAKKSETVEEEKKVSADSTTKANTANAGVENTVDDIVNVSEKEHAKPSTKVDEAPHTIASTSSAPAPAPAPAPPAPKARRPPRGYAMGPAVTSSTPTVSPAKATKDRPSPALSTSDNTATATGGHKRTYVSKDVEDEDDMTQASYSSGPQSRHQTVRPSSRSSNYGGRDYPPLAAHNSNNKRYRMDEQTTSSKMEYVVSLDDPSRTNNDGVRGRGGGRGRDRGYFRDQDQQNYRPPSTYPPREYGGGGQGRGPYGGGYRGDRSGGRGGRGPAPRFPPADHDYNRDRPPHQDGYNPQYTRQSRLPPQEHYRGGSRGRGRGRRH